MDIGNQTPRLCLGQEGQGFMEVIVAFGIMIMGIVSILILTSYNLAAAEYGANRLIASNLAREALEVIRNKRDSNWLAGSAWDQGFPVNSGDNLRTVNFTETPTSGNYVLTTVTSAIETCEDCKLYVQDTVFSHHVSSTFSGFRRLVEFSDICDPAPGTDADNLTIEPVGGCGSSARVGFVLKSRVQWTASNGDTREVAIEDRIFNWR